MKKLLLMLLFLFPTVFAYGQVQVPESVNFVDEDWYYVMVADADPDTVYSRHRSYKECSQNVTILELQRINAYCDQPRVRVDIEWRTISDSLLIADTVYTTITLTDTTYTTVQDTNLVTVNDTTYNEVVINDTSFVVINDTTYNEIFVNDTTLVEVTDTTYNEVIVQDTSIVVVNDTTYNEIVLNDTTYNEVIVNDTTLVEVVDTTYNEIVLNDTTYNEIVVNDTTYNDIVLNDTTYNEVIVQDTSYTTIQDTNYVVINDTTYNEIIVQDTTYNDVIINDTTYVEVVDTTYTTVTLEDTTYTSTLLSNLYYTHEQQILDQHRINWQASSEADSVTVNYYCTPSNMESFTVVPTNNSFEHIYDVNCSAKLQVEFLAYQGTQIYEENRTLDLPLFNQMFKNDYTQKWTTDFSNHDPTMWVNTWGNLTSQIIQDSTGDDILEITLPERSIARLEWTEIPDHRNARMHVVETVDSTHATGIHAGLRESPSDTLRQGAESYLNSNGIGVSYFLDNGWSNPVNYNLPWDYGDTIEYILEVYEDEIRIKAWHQGEPMPAKFNVYKDVDIGNIPNGAFAIGSTGAGRYLIHSVEVYVWD